MEPTKIRFMEPNMETDSSDTFFREYTSQDAIVKYTRATAGFGISYLLDHDYKAVYAQALALLPQEIRQRGISMLEFGCGGGMNLLHLVSVLDRDLVRVEKAIGTDFSPVLTEAAKREAKNYLQEEKRRRVEFYVAKNESLIHDLSVATGTERSKLNNSVHFIVGVNTVRYCHRAKKELECARDIADLLVPGGVCVVIDMNDRFLFFRTALKNCFRKQNEEECYIPSLEEYTAPFRQAGLDVIRSEHFCWVPHSSGQFMCYLLGGLSSILNVIARSRAMRSLVVLRKPINASSI
jgi:SAM-dependent methyltransferase